VKAVLVAACVVALGAGAWQARLGPSFDCTKAKQDVEKAICGNPQLADLDRAIASAYASARMKLDGAGQTALQKDQSQFLGTRDIALTWPGASLKEYMASRLELLRAVRSAPDGGDAVAFLGTWQADGGQIVVSRGKSGRLAIKINTVASVTARWVCDVEADATVSGGRIRFEEDDVTIGLSRAGAILRVDEQLPAGRNGRDYCGANGSISGSYFKVK
jgi:uncharacterized protein